MKGIILKVALLITLFFGVYLLLFQIDWMQLFQIESRKESTETKLGELFWDFFKQNETELESELIYDSLDSLVKVLCKYNDIDRESIKLHILEKDEINAFALPDGHIVVFTGLIKEAESPEALTGVLAHEIAHDQLKHVMKKLVREVGLSVLLSTATGGGGAETIKSMAKMLSSKAFDREMEKEADLEAVKYMLKAKINPEDFASFLYTLSDPHAEFSRQLAWISTHPESQERAKYVLDAIPYDSQFRILLHDSTWEEVKAELH